MKSKAHDHTEGLTGTAHNGATKFYELEEEKAFHLVQFFRDFRQLPAGFPVR
jgi:hypothetical protein